MRPLPEFTYQIMPSSAMSRRRTVVPPSGSLYSFSSIVAGSILKRQGAPLHENQIAPSASTLMPYGLESLTGDGDRA